MNKFSSISLMIIFGINLISPILPVTTAGATTVISVDPSVVSRGERIVFSVYVYNDTDGTVNGNIPDTLSCRIESEDTLRDLSAFSISKKISDRKMLPGGSFVKRTYGLALPADITGTFRLSLLDMDAPPVFFRVKDTPADETETEDVSGYTSLDSFVSLYQPYIANIAAYEPIYFLVGTDPKKSKFQFGFKYRFLNPDGFIAERHPWVKGLHFGYTQTSYWDLKSDSAPFEDTSYKPELFYLTSNIKTRYHRLKGFFIQSGFQHESNGRGGDLSRSTNFAYVKPIFIFYKPSTGLGLQVAPKFWGYVLNQDDTNEALDKYRGYFELQTKLGKANGFVLDSFVRYAQKGISVQLDLTYPLSIIHPSNLAFYFHAQYVNGLAESLIRYWERTEMVRLGFSIVR